MHDDSFMMIATWECGVCAFGIPVEMNLSDTQLLSFWCLFSFILRFWNQVFTFKPENSFNFSIPFLWEAKLAESESGGFLPVYRWAQWVLLESSSPRGWDISACWSDRSVRSSVPRRRQCALWLYAAVASARPQDTALLSSRSLPPPSHHPPPRPLLEGWKPPLCRQCCRCLARVSAL